MIIDGHVVVEHALRLFDGFEPSAPALDAEVLVEQGAVQALDDAVGLRPLDFGGAVLNRLELEEQLADMAVGAAAELTAVVRNLGPSTDDRTIQIKDLISSQSRQEHLTTRC